MDNLDPVEATEIFLEDAAAATDKPDDKAAILCARRVERRGSRFQNSNSEKS